MNDFDYSNQNESIVSFLTPKRETFYIDEDSTIRQVVEKMDFHKFTVIPLLNKKGQYIGSLSEGDILRYIKSRTNFNLEAAESIKIIQVSKYRSYEAMKIDEDVSKLIRLLLQQNFVPVVDDRKTFIGIIKRSTLMNFLSAKQDTK